MIVRAVFLFILLGVYFSGVRWGYWHGGRLAEHFLYMFQHASLVHLVGNWVSFTSFYSLLSRRINPFLLLAGSYVCAVVASFLSAGQLPTVGCSGMVCGLWGIYVVCSLSGYLKVVNWRKYWLYTGISGGVFFVCCFYPGINSLNHLFSLLGGMFVGLGVFLKWKISKG